MTGRIDIHKTAIIEDTAILIGDVRIGRDSYIGHHCIIGGPPQYSGWYPYPTSGRTDTRGVNIGDRVCIRENSQIHQGIEMPTTIDDDALIMASCHVSHDSYIGTSVTIAAMSILAGFTRICNDAVLGQGVVTHPWVVIGEHAMIGLNSSIVKHVMPYQKVAGSPAKLIGKNTGAGGDKEAWSPDVVDSDTWDRYAWNTQLQEALRNKLKETKT